MRRFNSSATAARLRPFAVRSFASLAGAHSRTAAFRRLRDNSIQPQSFFSSPIASPRSSISSTLPLLRSGQISPQSLRATGAVSRHFHTQTRLRQQQAEAKEEVRDRPREGATEEAKPSPEAEASEAKAKAEGSEEAKSEEQTAGEEGAKEEETKKDAPPPPPHGDKTPWQVFTETLQSEFKASKEWNEGTKQLAAGYQDFTQNPTLQKAKNAYTQSADAVGSTTSAALKTTGRAIGQSAAWAWETPVVRGIRKGAEVTGKGIERATRPLRETEAYKNVKETIDDGASSRYGGWMEREERKKRRELREAKKAQNGGPKEPMAEDPNAGTHVTLHKDSAFHMRWRDFRDSNPLMQSLFSLRSTYQESENPLISTARSISDRVAGFFAENETAMVIKKFREMDPSFQLEPFLQELREYILPEVLDAFVKGDAETLKLWLSAAQYQVWAALMQQYTTAGLKSDGRILDIRHVDILSAKILENEIPIFLISARTQEVHTYRNIKTGELAAGLDDKVQQVTYVIGMTRIPEDVSNPETRGWRMIELQKSARDYI